MQGSPQGLIERSQFARLGNGFRIAFQFCPVPDKDNAVFLQAVGYKNESIAGM